MKVIPAIDVKDGRCAQLVGGVAETVKYYGDVVDAAIRWVDLGADILHIVDLDAALGSGSNLSKVKEIRDAVDVTLHYGGGVRDYSFCVKLLTEYGMDRVVLGTLALQDYFRKQDGLVMDLEGLPSDLRNRLIVSIDSRGGRVVTHGWQKASDVVAADVMKVFQDLVWGFLYTDVDVEGRMQGVNIETTSRVVKLTYKPVIVSGGVSSLDDVRLLRDAGAWGVVLGKALYEGRLDFTEALRC